MKTLKYTLAALVAMLLSAPASAITWGEPDEDDHPHVVVLLFYQDGPGLWSCSGTLLTPYVVLTAGHCTAARKGVPNSATWVRNAPNIDYLIANELPNYASGAAWLDATWIRGTAVPHPDYDDFVEFPDTYDIGVVLLEQPIFVDTYGALPQEGQFDSLAKARGPIGKRSAVVVGYGLQGLIPAFYQDDFVRYQAVASVVNLGKGALIGEQNFMFTNNPGKGSGSGGTCFGDSGGPAFWIDPATGAETNIVMSVTSWGITPCVGVDYQFRTDTKTAQDFVNAWIGWTPGP